MTPNQVGQENWAGISVVKTVLILILVELGFQSRSSHNNTQIILAYIATLKQSWISAVYAGWLATLN